MKKITKTKSVQRLEKPAKQVVRIIKLPNKGDNGYTPEKGKDYFDGKTPTEEELLALIEPRIPKVENGYTPQKGIDYNDGEDGKTPTPAELLKLIKPLIPEPIPGKNGKPFPEAKVKQMVSKNVDKKIESIIEEVSARGNTSVEQTPDGMNLIIDGKKHHIQTSVYGPKQRNFIQLGDSPGTYQGSAGKFLKVNSTETGIEYGVGGSGAVVGVTGLNTDNTDPTNPIIQISVDGVTVTGLGTPGSPLVAVGDGTGDVHGPASATDGNIALFDGTTGKIIKNSSSSPSSFATAAQGTLADSALQPSDIASGTITARADDINFSGGSDGDVLTVQADGSLALETPSGGSGTVTTVSIASANGFAGSVANATTTPAITLSTSINSPVLAGNGTAISAATTTGTGLAVVLSGSPALTTPSIAAITVSGGILTLPTGASDTLVSKNSTDTLTNKSISGGQITSAVANATLAATATALATPRAIYGNNFDGSAALTQIIASTYGGTGNGFTKFTGPTTSEKTFTLPDANATIARTDAAQTFTGTQTFSQVITTANAITASGNAATIPVTSRHNIVTNNSAATLTVTLTTTSAVNMQTVVVQILDFSAVAQTITWVNTENSTVSAPVTSNGSTTLPLTVGFIYNNASGKWRCIAQA